MNEQMNKEVQRRRTFAIISHPDAGKTTLTEKLLLYGGAIRLAGSVKSRKTNRYAVSDWMEIEKQRGISVTSSVMQFEYNDFCINILDTPGHQDFSEDTYRTLMAADSAVMLIDAAKGVEAQTVKLFHVCKLRGIPIFTFINKMDRASRDPFDLIDEIETVLGIQSYPMNWPIGIDGDFQGIYNRLKSRIELYGGAGDHGTKVVKSHSGSVDDPALTGILESHYHDKLKEDIELLDMAGDEFDIEKVKKGQLTPIFFGSAMNNFGVQPFLEAFLEYAPMPGAKKSTKGAVEPRNDDFTAFIFKIQANMDPLHRDRLAFMRICSGKYVPGLNVFHVREGKKIRLTRSQQFMAQERKSVEEAWPGDIIGVFDPGIFRIGDTLSEKDSTLEFEGIPMFSPEFFSRVRAADSMKRKQFLKGLKQLSEEGAVQIFKEIDLGLEEYVIGAVGVLQFDVLKYRLLNEYRVELYQENLTVRNARWVAGDWDHTKLNLTSTTRKATDRLGRLVLLFENTWSIDWAIEHNAGLELTDTM